MRVAIVDPERERRRELEKLLRQAVPRRLTFHGGRWQEEPLRIDCYPLPELFGPGEAARCDAVFYAVTGRRDCDRLAAMREENGRWPLVLVADDPELLRLGYGLRASCSLPLKAGGKDMRSALALCRAGP